MPGAFQSVQLELQRAPKAWLVTGAAGFIGSHLVEALLRLDQRVIGLDNYSTGKAQNLEQVRQLVSPQQWNHFHSIQGDIRELPICQRACEHVDYVLHHAALGSVPASMNNPHLTHEVNVTGFLNILCAARDQRVSRVIYASSSAVYGDDPDLPKVEDRIGRPLSPYALSKLANELYADTFHRCFGVDAIGLRYFNVFGPRQDPNGPYAAVIPKWIEAMITNEPVFINGDGETSRDFCPVSNVVQANLLAALARPSLPDSTIQRFNVYNIALGQRTTLNELFGIIRDALRDKFPRLGQLNPQYRDFRPGDVRHSQADISRARKLLGYAPAQEVKAGLTAAIGEYWDRLPG
ncbi:MAG: SDR family oxidoreductase [Verrucomicrobia subdivision 3 bacterium]|nr:SDR family oxidoreductase [Limisphaerales bacterium]